MTNRFSYLCALLLSFCAVPSLPAQEETQPGRLPATVASPTATVSLPSTPTPTSSPTPPELTDVLFKNLKARSIGPAVMGGRVSDIAISPYNPFVFYVGLGHGGVFKTNDKGERPEFVWLGRWCLSVDRWRREVAERRIEKQPYHCADCCRSQKTGRRLRRRDGQPVGGWRRTRIVQDH